MAGAFGVITGIVVAKSGATLMARVTGQGNVPITQASIASMTWNVQDLNTGLSVGSGTVSVAATIFDALQQQDAAWTKDTPINPGPDGLAGYNFKWLQDPTLITWQWDINPVTLEVTPHQYQTDIEVIPTAGQSQKFRIPYRYTPIPSWP